MKSAHAAGGAPEPLDQVLELIERIYAAVESRAAWQDVATGISRLLDDAAVWLAIRIPGATPPASVFHVGIDDTYREVPAREAAFISERIWKVGPELGERFVRMADYSEGVSPPLAEGFLAPLGLEIEAPILHVTTPERAMLSSLIAVFRRRGMAPIREEQLAQADLLVPHLARAIELHGRLGDSEHSQVALHEVIDRIPTGILIVDRRHRPVITNRMADRIALAGDGFAIDSGGVRGRDADATAKLRQLIDSAANPAPGHELAGGGFMALERKSDRRPYPVLVTPILGRSEHESIAGAAALIFISDPEIREVSIVNVLMDLYGLTPAEAELAQLLSQGHSLEDAAGLRSVTLNTARSQLKQIFAKTDTRRQGELLQLVLSGVALIDSGDESDRGQPGPAGSGTDA